MPRPNVPQPLVEMDTEDPRIAGKDPSMIPGHPQCNYEKFMAAQRKVIVFCQGDQRNPQYKSFNLSFNGNHQITVQFDRPQEVPLPYAEMILLGSKGSTTDKTLMDSLQGQIANPIVGPIPGPISGDYAADVPLS